MMPNLSSQSDDAPIVNISLIPLDFKESEKIPLRFYFENENLIPRFHIKNPPPSTKYLAIVMEDIDAPGSNHTHWIVYNIDPQQSDIGGDILFGLTGKNSWTMQKYQGINPIQGRHHYKFTIYAHKRKIIMDAGYSSEDLKNKIIDSAIDQNSTTAYAERTGFFSLE